MPTYSLHAVNVGAFPIGETDKVITLFSAERGIVRAVAKGARKSGSKIGGRADVLNVNRLLMATGRSLEIISQAESIETFPNIRKDLCRLSFALYYAELTSHFGLGLADDSAAFFEFLCHSLRLQSAGEFEPSLLCLDFELRLLDWLGYKPELALCVQCREPLTDYRIALFHFELGGIVCSSCTDRAQIKGVAERTSIGYPKPPGYARSDSIHITPAVWKRLILAAEGHSQARDVTPVLLKTNQAARRVAQGYIEYRAGKRMKSLELIGKV